MEPAEKLHKAIAAVCPIDGVSIGRINNRATWDFVPAASATAQQRANARSVINTIDLARGVDDDLDVFRFSQRVQAAMLLAILTPIPAQRPAWVTNVLQAAGTRLQNMLNGRTPSGNEE